MKSTLKIENAYFRKSKAVIQVIDFIRQKVGYAYDFEDEGFN